MKLKCYLFAYADQGYTDHTLPRLCRDLRPDASGYPAEESEI